MISIMAKLIVGDIWRNEKEVVKIMWIHNKMVRFKWLSSGSTSFYKCYNGIDLIDYTGFSNRFHTLDKRSRLKRLLCSE